LHFYKNIQLVSTTVRQVVTEKPISWCGESQFPVSIIGDISYGNYNVSVFIFIEGTGLAGVAGHISNIQQNADYGGYYFLVSNTGNWQLLLNQVTVVASGNVPNFDSTKFHNVMLSFISPNVYAYLDDVLLTHTAQDSTRTTGWAGITSGWNFAQFSNFLLV